jgi:hypothetical protein
LTDLWSKVKGLGRFARRLRRLVDERGVPTRVPIDADLIADMPTYWAVFLAEHDALTTPLLFWTPGHAGVAARCLACGLRENTPGARISLRPGGRHARRNRAVVPQGRYRRPGGEDPPGRGQAVLRARIGPPGAAVCRRHHDIDRAVDQYLALLQLQCER